MSDIPVDVSVETPVDDFDAMGSEIEQLLAPPDEEIPVKRSQLQKYSKELGDYRKRYGGMKQAFGDADAEDVAALGQFYKALQSGDPANIKAASEWISGVIQQLTPAEQAAVNAEIKAEAKATGQTQAEVRSQLTPEDIEKLVDERANKAIEAREQKAREEAAVNENIQKMQAAGKALGEQYGVPGFGNPKSPLYATLLSVTNEVFQSEGGTIPEAMTKAAVRVIQELQDTHTAMLSMKKATAGAGARPTPQRGTEPVGRSEKIDSLEAAHQKFRQRRDSAVGN